MASPAQPVFGRRNASRPAPPRDEPAPVLAAAPDHAAFFAAVRGELEDDAEVGPKIVPRSGRAAFLAGLVVGCALVGFAVTGPEPPDQLAAVSGALGLKLDTSSLLPVLLALGVVGGARASATTVIVVNTALNAAGRTSHAAYALAGGIAAAAFAMLLQLLFAHAPAHGWAVEVLAGAAAGFVYRVFAGVRPAET